MSREERMKELARKVLTPQEEARRPSWMTPDSFTFFREAVELGYQLSEEEYQQDHEEDMKMAEDLIKYYTPLPDEKKKEAS